MRPRRANRQSMSQILASNDARGVIALELSSGREPAHAALPHALTAELAEKIGRDLAQLVPAVRELDLTLAGAHFDPAEVLRPGWPIHRRLDELRARAPGRDESPRLLAFGADADGSVPLPFQADATLRGAALRVVPFLLSGPTAVVRQVAETLEDVLLAQGMAQADTALLTQQGFGAQIEHARYLTVNDLAAMMSMQYEHQGLAALWPLIETALLAPEQEEWLATPPEPLLRYRDGEVRMALFDPAGWCAHYAYDRQDCQRLQRVYEQYLARQRQLAAVLEAHGMPVLYVHCESGHDAKQAMES